jgi:hypothetical protein
MHDPLDLWRAIRACAAPGAAVLVMHLIRPRSPIDAPPMTTSRLSKMIFERPTCAQILKKT